MKLTTTIILFSIVNFVNCDGSTTAASHVTTPLPATTLGPVNHHEEKTSKGELLFRVQNGNELELQNWFRHSSPLLKFTLKNVYVESIKRFSGWLYDLNMSDKSRLRLDIRDSYPSDDNVTQYWFEWDNLRHSQANPELCIHIGENGTSWFNTYQSPDQSWPMNPARTLPKTSFNALMEFDHTTPDGEAYYVMEQMYLNTDGFAVSFDEFQPLFIRRESGLLCFSVNNSYPYDPAMDDESYKHLRMWVNTGENVRNITNFIVTKAAFIPKAKYTEIPDEDKFTHPSFMVSFSSQEQVLNYVAKLNEHGLGNRSELIYIGYWNIRDYAFDAEQFPQPDRMISSIYQQRLRFSVQLYPEYDSEHGQAIEKLLLHYANGTTAQQVPVRILDLTREDAADFYSGLLRKLKYELDIHSFLTGSYSLSHMSMDNSRFPNSYAKSYLKLASGVAGRNLTSWFGYKAQHLPMFTQLATHWRLNESEVLPSIIPAVLAVSLGGYPFVSPAPVYFTRADQDSLNEELYIRWLQIVTLMPQMTFFTPGFSWDHSERTIELTKKFINLHAEHAPLIISLAKQRLLHGHPIIRPLWYLTPDDAATYKIADQFALGNDILVAPVVELGQRERIVYFPKGVWSDQYGANFTGPAEYKLTAPLEELLYFTRV